MAEARSHGGKMNGQVLGRERAPVGSSFRNFRSEIPAFWQNQTEVGHPNSDGLAEAGTAKLLTEVGALKGNNAAHFVQPRAHALANAVAQRFGAAGGPGG